MRVIHLSTPLSFRGGEQQLLYLVGQLHSMGVQQEIWCPETSALAQRLCELQIEVTPITSRLVAAWNLRREASGELVIHAHDSHAHTIAWLALLAGGNFKLLVSRRVARAPKAGVWQYGKYRHPKIHALLCVSEFVAKLHRESLGPDAPVRVVYDGVALQQTPPADLRAMLGLPAHTQLVGTIAALAPEKDFATFVKTCQHLADDPSLADVHFIYIGGGDTNAEASAKTQVAAAGLEARLHLLGFRQNATALLADFDVFLFTTRWEGLGSSILEAQLRGVPVVSTLAGGTGELVVDGQTGLSAGVGESEVLAKAVKQLLDNNHLRQRLIVGGKTLAAKMSVRAMAECTLAEYRESLT